MKAEAKAIRWQAGRHSVACIKVFNWKAHDPESVFFSPNFICDSNLGKLISFFRETRINLYLINLLCFFLAFSFLPFHRRFGKKIHAKSLYKHLARLCSYFLRDAFHKYESERQQKKVKLNYLWKYTQTESEEEKRHKKSTTFFEY